MARPRISLRLVLFASLALAGAALGTAQTPPEEEGDARTSRELLTEVLHLRDQVDFAVFETLGERRDEEALVALERSTLALFSPQAVAAVFEAFRHFVGVPELGARAQEFLGEQALEGYPH